MEQEQLKKFGAWFGNYVAGFYGNDEVINANLKLKEEHSRRVCEEMSYLAGELGLSDNQRRIADAIAILHDVGRFEQFVKHRTYSDFKSVNHCLVGVEVLRREKILEQIDKNERELIEKAIEYHGLIKLPDDLEGESLLFSKLIRDADKLDIFYVVMEYCKQYRDNPENFKLGLEFPDEPVYSAEVVKGILCGRRINYSKLRTLNDMMLCQLAWVYDVNFTATLKRIKRRRFLEKTFDFLPETEDIGKVREKILKYVDSKIEQDR
jgi:putative nucleotidyltransferase with HDIG domain